MNSRFYDPENARFIQEDSFDGNIYDPLSLNLYTYCSNNPISYYDPTGHFSVKSAVSKVKSAVKTVAKAVKNAVKETTKVVKKTVEVVKPAARPLAKAAVNKVVETVKEAPKKAVENWEVGINSMHSDGVISSAVASYCEGAMDACVNTIKAPIEFIKDPVGTLSDIKQTMLELPSQIITMAMQNSIDFSIAYATKNYKPFIENVVCRSAYNAGQLTVIAGTAAISAELAHRVTFHLL